MQTQYVEMPGNIVASATNVSKGCEQEGSGNDGSPQPTKGFTPFVGTCFTVNFIMGTGFLTLPYAFVQGGLVFSALLMLLAYTFVDLSKDLLLECMARTEALMPRRNGGDVTINSGSADSSGVSRTMRTEEGNDDQNASNNAPLPPWLSTGADNDAVGNREVRGSSPGHGIKESNNFDAHPFLMVKERKFELSDLCRLYLGDGMLRVYTIFLCFYMYLALWVYSSVFSSSMATSLPIKKEEDTDYYIYAAIFSVIVVPLSCLELEEQVFVQVLLTAGRVIMVVLMVGTVLPWGGIPSEDKFSFGYHESNGYANEESMAAPLFHFSGMYFSFPIIVWSFIFHHSIPVLSHQIEDKQKLGWIFRASFIVLGCAYLSVGLSAGWYFGENIRQSANLNWQYYTGGTGGLSEDGSEYIDIAWWARAISKFVVMFPAVDVISAFPLHAITLGNNLVGYVYGDHAAEVKRSTNILFRLLSCTPPIIGSLFVKRLGILTDYAGALGFVIALCFPALLFITSQRMAYAHRIWSETFYKTICTREFFATGLLGAGLTLALVVLLALSFGGVDY